MCFSCSNVATKEEHNSIVIEEAEIVDCDGEFSTCGSLYFESKHLSLRVQFMTKKSSVL